MKDLIRRILVVDPMKRIDAKGVRKHPWYSAFDKSHKLLTVINAVRGVSTSTHENNPPLSDYVVKQMVEKGFQEGVVKAAMNAGAHNAITATYKIMMRKVRERRDMVDALKVPLKLDAKKAAPTMPQVSSAREATVNRVLPDMPKSAREDRSEFIPKRPPSKGDAAGKHETKPGRELTDPTMPRVTAEKEALQKITALDPKSILAEIKRVCLVSNWEWKVNGFTIECIRGNIKLMVEIVRPKSSETNHAILVKSISGNLTTAKKYKNELLEQMKL